MIEHLIAEERKDAERKDWSATRSGATDKVQLRS
jgi:hypothetical protein